MRRHLVVLAFGALAIASIAAARVFLQDPVDPSASQRHGVDPATPVVESSAGGEMAGVPHVPASRPESRPSPAVVPMPPDPGDLPRMSAEAACMSIDATIANADEVVVLETPSGDGDDRSGFLPGRLPSDPPAQIQQLARMRAYGGRGAEPPAPGDAAPTQGTLRAKGRDGESLGEFPLRHTEVRGEVSGYLARTEVEQRYENTFDQVIEAVYVFPLPTMAAINDFSMEVAGRRIVGVIRPRAEAERIYAEARQRGQTASLLTQERPNIFTQNVANIEPGGTVTIRITYFERLNYEDGHFTYVFPMVVGPRYIPGQPVVSGDGSAPVGGGGTSPATTAVPDAPNITPPVLRPGERSGHDIAITLDLDAGLPITDLASVAHEIVVEERGPSRRVIRLAPKETIPNRDLVVRWSVAGPEMQFGVLAHRGEEGGFFTLLLQPPLDPPDDRVMPREITFIMDISGSMAGTPIEMSKAIVRRSLDRLRPDDVFNIFVFASGNGQLWLEPRPRAQENVDAARAYLDTLHGSGGTEMLAGVQRALRARHDPARLQMYVFLTDGYIGNEDQILATIRNEGQEARWFAFGPGSSVNRYLIDGIAEYGHGAAQYANPRDSEHADRVVRRFFDAIDSPVLVDIRVEWGGLPVLDVYPSRIPDLFAGQTIQVIGRFTGAAEGTATVVGRVGTREARYPVPVRLPASEPAHASLGPVWARHKIHDLSGAMLGTADARKAEIEREITDLAVEFRLVSQFTSFVAVDESRIIGDGVPLRILQPVELPEGVSYEGAVGFETAGEPVSLPAWGATLILDGDGHIRVAEAAEGSLVPRGATIVAVNHTVVTGLRHLEALLLQSGGSSVTVTFDPDGDRTLPMP